jgi:hypothetical protein
LSGDAARLFGTIAPMLSIIEDMEFDTILAQ